MHARTTHPTGTTRQDRRGWSRWHIAWSAAIVTGLGLTLLGFSTVHAKTFHCSAGDVTCLIASMNEANASGKKNEIRLEAGVYSLIAVDNNTNGRNCLPSITSALTIQGAGAQVTIIERPPANPFQPARFIHVAAAGTLTLEALTLTGGGFTDYLPFAGGALFNNGGTVTIRASHLLDNQAFPGGAIGNAGGTIVVTDSLLTDNTGLIRGGAISNFGTMTIARSTIARNIVFNDCCFSIGGAIENGGTMTITDSSLIDNAAPYVFEGGAIANSGTLTIISSTLARNDALYSGSGGAISNRGTLTILNSTLVDNSANNSGGGLANNGTIYLQNTILALNTTFGSGPDCVGTITSRGNNIIGNPTGCTITLQGTDRIGDPGLGPYTDDDTPGNGHFPLLATSQAINAGNDVACPKTDQLGEHWDKPCDIGAIEFQGKAVSSR